MWALNTCLQKEQTPQRSFALVTSWGMPSQMRVSLLLPSLSHVVGAGASRVHAWHGNGSNRNGRRQDRCMMKLVLFLLVQAVSATRSGLVREPEPGHISRHSVPLGRTKKGGEGGGGTQAR